MIASLLLVFLILICYVIYKNKTLPPGPYGLPYLGIGLLFGKPDYRRLDQMAADYGDIVSFRAFGRLFVCLNSSAVIREAMLKYSSVFNGRATMNLNGFLANKHGISNYNGNDIVHIKKLFNRLYKDLNFVEDVTTLAADELTIHLKHNFHHIKSCIGLAVFKTTYCLLFASSNCPLRNQDILEFLNQMSSNNEAHSIISAKQILPFLKRPIFSNNRLIQKLFGMSASITRYGKMMSYIKYLIREGIVHQTGNNVISKYQELFCTSESTKGLIILNKHVTVSIL